MALPKPQLNGDVLAYDVAQSERLNEIADYVVERGTISNWKYEKWASGKLVQRIKGAFGAQTSPSVKDSFGLYSNKFYIPDYGIPFEKENPILSCTIGAGTVVVDFKKGYEASRTGAGVFILGASHPSISVTAAYDVTAEGLWK